jgi:heat shock protein HslJ
MKRNQTVFSNLQFVAAIMLAIFSMTISGCSSGSDNSKTQKMSTSKTALNDTKWMIQTLNGSRVLIPEGGKEVFITFSNDGKANGSSGCNTFNGKAEVSGSSMKLGPMATTRMMCPEQMDTEKDFLAALNNTASYSISGNTLSIMDAGKNVLATFTGFKGLGGPGQ